MRKSQERPVLLCFFCTEDSLSFQADMVEYHQSPSLWFVSCWLRVCGGFFFFFFLEMLLSSLSSGSRCLI